MVDRDERTSSAEFRRMAGQETISLLEQLREVANNNPIKGLDPQEDFFVKQAHSMAEKAGLVPYIKEPS